MWGCHVFSRCYISRCKAEVEEETDKPAGSDDEARARVFALGRERTDDGRRRPWSNPGASGWRLFVLV
jgi:hypothetical protein